MKGFHPQGRERGGVEDEARTAPAPPLRPPVLAGTEPEGPKATTETLCSPRLSDLSSGACVGRRMGAGTLLRVRGPQSWKGVGQRWCVRRLGKLGGRCKVTELGEVAQHPHGGREGDAVTRDCVEGVAGKSGGSGRNRGREAAAGAARPVRRGFEAPRRTWCCVNRHDRVPAAAWMRIGRTRPRGGRRPARRLLPAAVAIRWRTSDLGRTLRRPLGSLPARRP